MARVIAGTGSLQPQAPRRRGKYDHLLDGRVWSVARQDISWMPWPQYAVRALRDRARVRGLRLHVQRLEDGSLAVQARRKEARATDAY